MRHDGSICVLVSGGLDSDVLAGQLAGRYRHVYPVYVRQGLAWERAELYWLKRFLKALKNPRIQPLHVLAAPMLDLYAGHWSLGKKPVPGTRTRDAAVYLPGRNLILLVKTAVFCAMHRIPRIALASLGQNPFSDAMPDFFRLWGRALGLGLDAPLTILAPYRQLSKAAVIKKGKRFPLALSFSCLSPRGRRHCGACNKCAERQKAFRQARIPDRTRYAS
jgi:7-cyano-7-deazaguanine synthase